MNRSRSRKASALLFVLACLSVVFVVIAAAPVGFGGGGSHGGIVVSMRGNR